MADAAGWHVRVAAAAVAAIALAAILLPALVLGSLGATAAVLVIYSALVGALRPAGLNTSWAYMRALR